MVLPSGSITSSVMQHRQLGCNSVEGMSSSLSYISPSRDAHSSSASAIDILLTRHPVPPGHRIHRKSIPGYWNCAFINSEFNHDGDSYRSPWSNEYFPTSEGHKLLPNELRELEVQLNTLMKLYTKLYYAPTAVSSVFIWEQGDSISSGFNCAVLFKNVIEKSKGIVNSTLDSINIINVKFRLALQTHT